MANLVVLIGRTTKDPDLRYSQNGTAITRFTLAVDRPVKSGEEKKADFPQIICFGKTAEFVANYIVKGQKIAVQGRLQTGSYQKNDGTTVYTTDVIADRVEPCEYRRTEETNNNASEWDSLGEEINVDLPF